MPRKPNNQSSFQRFQLVRRIIREGYLYGFRAFEDYTALKASTFYNQRSLAVNCLHSVMDIPENGGKLVFHRKLYYSTNPFYEVFKARPMKNSYQYALHFALTELMSDKLPRSLAEISRALLEDYCFSDSEDKKKLQMRLQYYVNTGVLARDAQKRYYAVHLNNSMISSASELTAAFPGLRRAAAFFTEVSPLGVIGSMISDSCGIRNEMFVFKRAFFYQTLDAPVMLELFYAIRSSRTVSIRLEQTAEGVQHISCFLPLCIRSGAADGRQYAFGYDADKKQFVSLRIDFICTVSPSAHSVTEHELFIIRQKGAERQQYMWASWCSEEEYAVTIRFCCEKQYQKIILRRSCRFGQITEEADGTLCFRCQVTRARELLPWLLAQIGEIRSVSVTNLHTGKEAPKLSELFAQHFRRMTALYEKGEKPKYVRKQYVPVYNPAPNSETSPLFQPVCSRYTELYGMILAQASAPQTTAGLNSIIRKAAGEQFRDMYLTVSPAELIESGMLTEIQNGRYISFLKNPQPSHRPLMQIERDWLRTILADDRIGLFLTEQDQTILQDMLKDAGILYDNDSFCYYDRYHMGDPVRNADYQQIMRTIQDALEYDSELRITYQTEKEKAHGEAAKPYIVFPLRLEYSTLHDRFWLLCLMLEQPSDSRVTARSSDLTVLRTANIRTAECIDGIRRDLVPDFADLLESELIMEPIRLKLYPNRNAVDRFMIAFSPYYKETYSDPKSGVCTVTIRCQQRDRKAVLRQLRSFGSAVEILSPKKLRQEIRKRLRNQAAQTHEA